MEIFIEPSAASWKELCVRPSSENPVVRERVDAILKRVAQDGDKALFELSAEIDGVEMSALEISQQEISQACAAVSEDVKKAIEAAAANIRAFHQAQIPQTVKVETMPGVCCMQKAVPIQKVGIYIPGGTAPLFSTVLMLAIPAQVAGCPDITLCTPVNRKSGKVAPEVLYAASVCGVSKIYKVGGAQAIAAMAYGTETIAAVDKIFGPGNQYVTCAKQALGNIRVAIDMPAGPSEVMVMADETAQPSFVAGDLLSQAEHGADSQVMLLCTSEEIAKSVCAEVERQSAVLERGEFISKSLEKSRAIVLRDRKDMIAFANAYGAEHLIISMADYWGVASEITSAGSVFLGNYSPESAGDYASGTNHTLPTCGWSRAFSGVNIDSFIRKITYQELSREGLESLSGIITTMADAEGLQAHANAVKVRKQ